jgi:hypothetical protein
MSDTPDEGVIRYSDFPFANEYMLSARPHVTADGIVYPWADPMSKTYLGRVYERADEEPFYVYTRVTDKGTIEVYAGTSGFHEFDRKVTTIRLPNGA